MGGLGGGWVGRWVVGGCLGGWGMPRIAVPQNIVFDHSLRRPKRRRVSEKWLSDFFSWDRLIIA